MIVQAHPCLFFHLSEESTDLVQASLLTFFEAFLLQISLQITECSLPRSILHHTGLVSEQATETLAGNSSLGCELTESGQVQFSTSKGLLIDHFELLRTLTTLSGVSKSEECALSPDIRSLSSTGELQEVIVRDRVF